MASEPVVQTPTSALDNTVLSVARCHLRAEIGVWPFAAENATAILANWAERTAKNPRLFDGVIYVLANGTISAGVFSGAMRATDFKSFLCWRDQGYPDPHPRDCFGSALLRSAEGHVLLGRQRGGEMNGGLAYPPGGFIDPRDVGADGSIDIDASIAREIREETGLDPADLRRAPGYRIVFAGPLVAIAAEYRSDLSAVPLRQRILDYVANDPDAELTDVVIVRAADELEATTPPYAKLLLRAVL